VTTFAVADGGAAHLPDSRECVFNLEAGGVVDVQRLIGVALEPAPIDVGPGEPEQSAIQDQLRTPPHHEPGTARPRR